MRLLPALFLTAFSLTAANQPSGESILARSLAKSGGAQAFARVKSAIMTGTVEMVGHNLSGPVAVYQQGEKTYTSIELPGIGKVEEGFDGETAWEVNALTGARIKEGEEKSATVRASKLGLLNSWRDDYKEATAWKVQMLPKEGKPEIFYFDKTTSLLVRMTQTIASALGEIPVDALLGDYRTVGGVLVPFSMTQKAMSQVMTMHFDKVEWNPAIPAGRFDLPEAVRILAARAKP